MAGAHINDLQKAHAAGGVGNTEVTAFASAVRTASGNSGDLVNAGSRGLHVVIDMTAVPTVETVTFTIEAKDPLKALSS